MKKILSVSFLIGFCLFSCNSKNEIPNTDIGIATTFINDLHRANFKEARQLLLKEENNLRLLERYQEYSSSRPKEEQDYYKSADIVINEISNVSDSVSIINYSTHYKKEEKNKVKVVRINGQWQVDFKYTLSGNL